MDRVALAARLRHPRLTSMEPSTVMDIRIAQRHARTAGALYLLNVVTGLFGLAWVPSQVSGHGDAALVVQRIAAHEALFRAGIAAELVCYLTFLLLPLALYRLFGTTRRTAAVLMVALAAASVPLSLAALAHRLDVLTLLGHAAWLEGFSAAGLQAQVMQQLAAYGNVQMLAQVFWGLWLLPFGWLALRSGQLPRVLGVLLVLGGLSYVVDFLGQLFVAGYDDSAFAGYVVTPAALGEIGTSLWLLAFGARPPRHAG